MANPLEFIAQMQAAKDATDEMLATTDTGWFVRAAAWRLTDWVLSIALDAGPPAAFAESLGVDEQQARVLYSRVLRAAMLRQREVALNGRTR